MAFTKEELLGMYEEVVLTRVLGETIIQYIFSGKIGGSIHPSIGQEGVIAGVISAFKKSNIKTYGTSTHRMQAVMAYRVGLKPFVCELLCRAGGPNDGISGEYHMTDVEKTMLPATGALGGAWAIADGFAWALKHEGRKDEICFAPYGDGAASQGAAFEALNIAAIYKLPVLFFIENNGIAMSTPVHQQYPVENLSDRAAAFGMKGVTVDGNDVIAVAEAVLEGMRLAANNEPSIVEAKTTRWEGHYIGDRQELYRDLSFRQHLEDIDPVLIMQKKLLDWGYIDDAYIAATREKAIREVEEAFDEGLSHPAPTREQVLDLHRLYANPDGGEL